uniref:hypothetical protein n=1 Tax=uncultured Corynebacterium sp. TaxID=159447 RepID=UPI0025D770CE
GEKVTADTKQQNTTKYRNKKKETANHRLLLFTFCGSRRNPTELVAFCVPPLFVVAEVYSH